MCVWGGGCGGMGAATEVWGLLWTHVFPTCHVPVLQDFSLHFAVTKRSHDLKEVVVIGIGKYWRNVLKLKINVICA